jgi:hypothetical protein
VIIGATNAPVGGARSTNAAAATASTNVSPASGENFAGMDREERRRRMESMSPEEREKMRAAFRAARGGDGQGGPGGPGGGSGRSRPDSMVPRTVYLIETNAASGKAQVTLKAVTVKSGISDGVFTEVLEGLKEGDVVAAGVNLPAGAAASTAVRPGSSPFGGPFGGGMRPR